MAVMRRFRDWRLRTKMAVLLVMASLLPLGVATWISINNARAQVLEDAEQLMAARAEQLVERIDTFNAGYQTSVTRMAMIPDVRDLLLAPAPAAARMRPALQALLSSWPSTDPVLRGAALLDATGTVAVATEPALLGRSMAVRSFVRQALRGSMVISDVFLAEPEVGGTPTIAYLAPIMSGNQQVGVAVLWAHAMNLREALRESSGLAGEGSFAALFDALGIRISHAFNDDVVYHPAIQLSPEVVNALVQEQRFGAGTRELAETTREVSDFVRSAIVNGPVPGMSRDYAPSMQEWSHIIARRCITVPWTVIYSFPERTLTGQMAQIVRQKLLFGAAIALAALVVGLAFAAVILKPVRALTVAAQAIAAGNSGARAGLVQADELGDLGKSFDTMAGRIEQQAVELVQQSEAQYRKLFEPLTEAFSLVEVIFDADGKAVDGLILDTNPAYHKVTGIANAQGRRLREIAPDMQDDSFEVLGSVALTGTAAHYERRAPMLGRHFEVSAFRVGDESSRKVAVLLSDITDRMDRERKRQAQLERLALLQQITRAIGERQDLASIFQIVVRTLEDQLPIDFGCICLYEPEAKRLLVTRVGVRSQELAMELALTEHAYIDIDENGLSHCVRGKLVYEPDISKVPFAFPQRLASGGLRAFVAAPLLVESQVFGVLVAARRAPESFSSIECEFLQQLSEHVALAAHHANLYSALQTAYEDLRRNQQAVMQQERLRSLGQMASGIAHDINNAISPVALYTDALLEREAGLSEQGRDQLQTIQRAIHDVAATVARMREFYRQRGTQVMLAPVQLNGLVPQVVELTRARWQAMSQERGITVEVCTELDPALPSITGAESELREALTNLVLNAVDAMPQGGTLTLRTRATPAGLVQIEVADTGLGMDEDARRRCLEPFFTTKGERGTGLGLAMVYGAVQRHSADVEIESAIGQGTTIRLIFSASGQVVLPVELEPLVVLSGRRILVIDDDPVLLQTLRITLEGDGHLVTTASGGREGIDRFFAAAGKQPFQLVITDLGMPYVDGRKVAAAIKSVSPGTPVIMLTGWGQRLVADGDIPPHVDKVLGKPPKLRDLREALAQVSGSLRS
jgi:signal transduction histidine kinase/ActR/RegA family two-component response regulator/methyl-accepting chemotaxis protein